MLRDQALIPLSRGHQHTLALCVQIVRALDSGAPDTAYWWGEVVRQFRAEIELHFRTEEEVLFPVAAELPGLAPLVEELRADHQLLRSYVQRAVRREMSANDLRVFANSLSEHIRKEERRLFQQMQALMNEEDLSDLGEDIERFAREHGGGAGAQCSLPH